MKTILVTGSEGFVGSHFIKALKERPYNIILTSHPRLLPDKKRFIPLDISNFEMVQDVVKKSKPDIIFHLAAISSVSKSFRDRLLTFNTNIIGTSNLLEAAKNLKKYIKFIFISSCEVYGGGDKISEKSEAVLKNPYAISKYAAELICQNYASSELKYVILRPFTHTGPGQTDTFVLPNFTKQIAEIEKGKKPPLIEVGNMEVKREFLNVEDIVAAYSLAIERCRDYEIYNISSGRGYTISQAIEILRGFSRRKFETKVAPSRLRETDIPILIGDGEKFSKITGWQPKIKFEKTLEDLLNYWRAKT